VLVYNIANRVYFTNYFYKYWEDAEKDTFRENLKIRRGDWPSMEEYSEKYDAMALGLVPESYLDDDGVFHQLAENPWSYTQVPSKQKEFDETKPITKKTYVYAYYEDNREEVTEARDALEAALLDAIKKADDYFLTRTEASDLLAAIQEAQEIFDTRPMVPIEQLEEALRNLTQVSDPLDTVLDTRYTHYEVIQSNVSSGGSSSGGGGKGGGSKANPFVPETEKYYTVGTNGNWSYNAETGKWSFVLNGGIPLTSTWGKLQNGSNAVENGWYHFNVKGEMDYGWIQDDKGNWYNCN
jgi:glucan-binding YG repeat protein